MIAGIADDPVERVVALLTGVQRTRQGYKAICPAHSDHKPSLDITRGDNGSAVLICRVGCATEDVLARLGLTMADLFPKKEKPHEVAAYKYRDEAGALLYETVRFEPKDFRQRTVHADGSIEWRLNGVQRVLYKLPELIAADPSRPVFIVEGEKDVLTLMRQKQVATCNVGGAGKWRDEYNRYFEGRDVVILPDNDEPGRKHAEAVGRALKGIARSVRVIELPGLPPKGDVTDWFGLGHTVDELSEALDWSQEYDPVAAKRARYKSLDDLLALPRTPQRWIVEDLYKAAGASILASRPKVGKSKLSRTACVCIAGGRRFLRRDVIQGPVIYLGLEESPEDVIEDFELMGGKGLPIYPIFDDLPAKPADRPQWLREMIIDLGAVFVVIDPTVLYLGLQDDAKYAAVYQAMMPTVKVGRETGAHISFLLHEGKATQAELLQAHSDEGSLSTGTGGVMGSTAFVAAVDCTLIMKRRPKDNTRIIYSETRRGNDLPETVLQMDYDTKLVSVQGTLKDVVQQRAVAGILAYLRSAGTATERMIRLGSGIDSGAVAIALRTMLDSGDVIREGQGKSHDPFMYRLADGV